MSHGGFNPPQGSGANLGSVSEDVLPDADNTRDLGSSAKRWATLYAVLAIMTSAIIGGVLLEGNTQGSLNFNSSINVSGNVTANNFFFHDGSSINGSGDMTAVNTAGKYITGGAATGDANLLLNETELNTTIDTRDSDTTYTNASWNLGSIPGSITEANISDLVHYVDQDALDAINNTNDLNLPLLNTSNITFGTLASISVNSTTLIIKVN